MCPSASYISPALLADRDFLRELLLLSIDDQGTPVKFSWNTGLISVRVFRCIDDGLLIERIGEGTAEGGVVAGGGGGSENGEEDLHGWIGLF